jgi:hypothetical protein
MVRYYFDNAKATKTDQSILRVRHRRVRDIEIGEVSETVGKTRNRPWSRADPDGSILLWVKYGNTNLGLAKGKSAIRISDRGQLVPTLETVRDAVRAGELDKLIEAAVAGFKKRF